MKQHAGRSIKICLGAKLAKFFFRSVHVNFWRKCSFLHVGINTFLRVNSGRGPGARHQNFSVHHCSCYPNDFTDPDCNLFGKITPLKNALSHFVTKYIFCFSHQFHFDFTNSPPAGAFLQKRKKKKKEQ